MQGGDHARALDHFLEAVRLAPERSGMDLALLGVISDCLSLLKPAGGAGLRYLEELRRRHPDNPSAHEGMVIYLYNQGRFAEGEAAAAAAARRFPAHAGFVSHRISCFERLGRREEPLACARAFLARNPASAAALAIMARCCGGLFPDRTQAGGYFEAALVITPDDVGLIGEYCRNYLDVHLPDPGAVAALMDRAYAMALRLPGLVPRKRHGELVEALVQIQPLLGKMTDFRTASAVAAPMELVRYGAGHQYPMVFMSCFSRVETPADRQTLLDSHRLWGERVEQYVAGSVRPPRPLPPSGRARIRIGILSSDLRRHPVAWFAQPVLEQFDRDRFEIFCYSRLPPSSCPVQKRLAGAVTAFRHLHRLPEAERARTIREDGLDVLFELGGLSLHSDYLLLPHGLAPFHVSWLGYPHSLGLPSIDRMVTDRWVMPTGPGLMAEQPLMMPETWLSMGDLGFPDALPVRPPPELHEGVLSFGVTNMPYKISPAALDCWARILERVPRSRFMLLRHECGIPALRENMRRHFADRGIDPARIVLVPVTGWHLPLYHNVDVALDTFPHGGGTTTCEALWMGVPVVARRGAAFFERLAWSNLNNCGLGDLCGGDDDACVRIAVDLALDQQRRVRLRQTMRQRIRSAPLGQTERFVRHFETKVRELTGK